MVIGELIESYPFLPPYLSKEIHKRDMKHKFPSQSRVTVI